MANDSAVSIQRRSLYLPSDLDAEVDRLADHFEMSRNEILLEMVMNGVEAMNDMIAEDDFEMMIETIEETGYIHEGVSTIQ